MLLKGRGDVVVDIYGFFGFRVSERKYFGGGLVEY